MTHSNQTDRMRFANKQISDGTVQVLTINPPAAAVQLYSPLPLLFSINENQLATPELCGVHPGQGLQKTLRQKQIGKIFVQRIGNAGSGLVAADATDDLVPSGQLNAGAGSDAVPLIPDVQKLGSYEFGALSSSANATYTVPAGYELIVTQILLFLADVAEYVSGPELDIYGSDDAGSLGQLDLSADFDTAGTYAIFTPAKGAAVLPAGTDLIIDVDTAASADTFDMRADVFGYLNKLED